MFLESLMCVALAVYTEARGEPPEGQVAVAQVILNRAHDARFPDAPCDVVWQGVYDQHGRVRRYRCQFSALCDGRPETVTNKQAWGQAVMLSALAIAGLAPDVTAGALWYHEASVNPYWAGRPDVQIGRHRFYSSVGR